jgi:hypothetical protein
MTQPDSIGSAQLCGDLNIMIRHLMRSQAILEDEPQGRRANQKPVINYPRSAILFDQTKDTAV